jgi:hypothetical protein
LGAVLLRAERQLATLRPARPSLRVARDSLTDMWRVSATVSGRVPVSVSFAVWRAGSSSRWRLHAADDSPPYRAFLDPLSYRRRERVHLVAVARALDGRTAVSAVRSVVPRR